MWDTLYTIKQSRGADNRMHTWIYTLEKVFKSFLLHPTSVIRLLLNFFTTGKVQAEINQGPCLQMCSTLSSRSIRWWESHFEGYSSQLQVKAVQGLKVQGEICWPGLPLLLPERQDTILVLSFNPNSFYKLGIISRHIFCQQFFLSLFLKINAGEF